MKTKKVYHFKKSVLPEAARRYSHPLKVKEQGNLNQKGGTAMMTLITINKT